MQMRALKTFRYARKPYGPGEPVEIRPQDVRAAIALGWVEYVFAPLPKPTAPTYNRRDMVAAPPAAAAPANDTALAALRADYEVKIGRKPWGGWDADKLREKISALDAKKQSVSDQTGE